MFTNHFATLVNRYGYEAAQKCCDWFYTLSVRVRRTIKSKDVVAYCIENEKLWK